MKIAGPVLLLVVATALVTMAAIASFLAPPFLLDSRDVLIISEGLAGLVLAVVAVRLFVGVHRQLKAR
jgi:hypothetical protein